MNPKRILKKNKYLLIVGGGLIIHLLGMLIITGAYPDPSLGSTAQRLLACVPFIILMFGLAITINVKTVYPRLVAIIMLIFEAVSILLDLLVDNYALHGPALREFLGNDIYRTCGKVMLFALIFIILDVLTHTGKLPFQLYCWINLIMISGFSFLKVCEEIADQANEYRIMGSVMFAAAYTLYYIGLMCIASPLGKNETGISDVVYDVAYNLKKYINEDGELILTIPDIRSETNKLIRCALDTENKELLDALNIMRDISPCEYYRKRIDHIPSDEQLKNAVEIIASEEEKSKPGSYGDLFAKKLREILANNDNFRSSTLKISKCMFDY